MVYCDECRAKLKQPRRKRGGPDLTMCKICGGEIIYGGRGPRRKYCTGCAPLIKAAVKASYMRIYNAQRMSFARQDRAYMKSTPIIV